MQGIDNTSDLITRIQGVMEHLGLRHHDRTGRDYFTAYGETLYDWELFFDGIALAYLSEENLTENGIQIFLSEQDGRGFIRRNSRGKAADAQPVWEQFEAEEVCKPFLAQLALMLSRMRGDASWLGEDGLIRLNSYIGNWHTAQDRDGNGLSEWMSAPHAGTDTQFERVGAWRSGFCEGVDLNSYLHRECLAAAALAVALGKHGIARDLAERADRTKSLVQDLLWDPADGFFFDRDARTDKRIRVKSAAAFLTLWSGIATETQAEELVSRHLRNPNAFWTPYPVPSYARSQPGYTQYYEPPPGSDATYALGPGHANWCGGMWPHWNYLIVHGLADYGYIEEARHIAGRFFDVVATDPMMYEWYDAETGAGQGIHPFCAGATALGAMLPTELRLGFDPVAIAPVAEPLDFTEMRQALGISRPFTPAPHGPLRIASAPHR